MPQTPALITIDWGTTRCRAYLVDVQGAVRASLAESLGILNVPDGDFDAVFQRLLGPWLQEHGAVPAIASGMIGSRQGWREAPYAPCPAGAAEIARDLTALTTRTGHKLWLVPGVTFEDADGVPDVMRGEETQIIGAISAATESAHGLFVLPGTHSKWVMVEDGRITWFATFMSGEVFALLNEHSILARLMAGHEQDPAAFQRGLDYAATSDGGLLKRLFSARTLGLFHKLPATGLRSYLSGLIIGSEITEGLECAARRSGCNAITVVGDSALSELYREALTRRGVSCSVGTEDAVVAGLFRIAKDAGLLEQSRG